MFLNHDFSQNPSVVKFVTVKESLLPQFLLQITAEMTLFSPSASRPDLRSKLARNGGPTAKTSHVYSSEFAPYGYSPSQANNGGQFSPWGSSEMIGVMGGGFAGCLQGPGDFTPAGFGPANFGPGTFGPSDYSQSSYGLGSSFGQMGGDIDMFKGGRNDDGMSFGRGRRVQTAGRRREDMRQRNEAASDRFSTRARNGNNFRRDASPPRHRLSADLSDNSFDRSFGDFSKFRMDRDGAGRSYDRDHIHARSGRSSDSGFRSGVDRDFRQGWVFILVSRKLEILTSVPYSPHPRGSRASTVCISQLHILTTFSFRAH
jgi:hypothetical protein